MSFNASWRQSSIDAGTVDPVGAQRVLSVGATPELPHERRSW